ncbi:uncharacterized protein [Antedon mediterranea]|uniref:uncharacterized protein isoform X2 n=1 Tax=Antedon mediterranea TaxID=105859 RepID=UPI003AF5B21A
MKPTCIENPAFDPRDDDSLASPSFIETRSSKDEFVQNQTTTVMTANNSDVRSRCLCVSSERAVSIYEIALVALTLMALVIGVSLAVKFTAFYDGIISSDDMAVENGIEGKTAVVERIKKYALAPPPPPIPPPFPPRLNQTVIN